MAATLWRVLAERSRSGSAPTSCSAGRTAPSTGCMSDRRAPETEHPGPEDRRAAIGVGDLAPPRPEVVLRTPFCGCVDSTLSDLQEDRWVCPNIGAHCSERWPRRSAWSSISFYNKLKKTLVLTLVWVQGHRGTRIRRLLHTQQIRGLLAGLKPENITQPLPPAASTQITPSFMALWEQTRDLTYITVESGRVVGRSLQLHVTAVVSGWAMAWLPKICASLVGGAWAAGPGAALISGFRSRSKAWAWAGGEAAVQGGALQSRWVHAPRAREGALSLALRVCCQPISCP